MVYYCFNIIIINIIIEHNNNFVGIYLINGNDILSLVVVD